MNTDEAALLIARVLDDLSIPYMIVGGYSSNIHGIPRSTRDVDIVLSVSALAFPDLLPHLGPGWTCDPQFSFETNTGTVRQIIEREDSALKVELFALSHDPHDQSRFQRRIRRQMAGQSISFPTAEDVIVWKLRWARPKDLDDIANIILVRSDEGDPLDWDYIRKWCGAHGTAARLDAILESLRHTIQPPPAAN